MKPEMRLSLHLFVALVLAGAALAAARWLLDARALTPGLRLAAGLLPAVGGVPLVAATVRAVRYHGEYWQRIQLVAGATAFAGTAVAAGTLAALRHAGVIAWWDAWGVLPLMAALYAIGLATAYLRYR